MSLIHVTVVSEGPFYNIHGLPMKLTESIHSFFEFTLAREFSRRTVRAYAYDLVVFFRDSSDQRRACGIILLYGETRVGRQLRGMPCSPSKGSCWRVGISIRAFLNSQIQSPYLRPNLW